MRHLIVQGKPVTGTGNNGGFVMKLRELMELRRHDGVLVRNEGNDAWVVGILLDDPRRLGGRGIADVTTDDGEMIGVDQRDIRHLGLN